MVNIYKYLTVKTTFQIDVSVNEAGGKKVCRKSRRNKDKIKGQG